MSNAPIMRAVVHLGPMKTGTTALAAFLTKSARAGRVPPGMVFPVDDEWWPREGSIHKHQVLVAIGGLNPASVGGRNRVVKDPDEVLARLRSLVDAHRGDPVERVSFFFICEGAESYMDPDEFARNLLSVFDEVTMCLVIRDQVQSIASRLSHGIKVTTGRAIPPSKVVRFARHNLERGRFDFGQYVERWGPQLGIDLVVVPYFEDDIGTYRLIDRVLEACGLPRPPSEEGIEGRRIHPALSARNLWTLWALKRLAQRSRARALRSLALLAYERVKLRSQRQSSNMASSARPWRPSDGDARQIRDFYRESNERFADWLGDRRTEPQWQRWFAALRG
jgi:hypothetical protein